MEWKLLLYDLSPYINSFESMAISSSFFFFLFQDLHGSLFFLFFKDLHGSSFFKIAHMPHFRNTRERDHLIMEFFFVDEWNGIANFQYRSLAGGVHVILVKQL